MMFLESLLNDIETTILIFGDGMQTESAVSSIYDRGIFSRPYHISLVYNIEIKLSNVLYGTPKVTYLYSLK